METRTHGILPADPLPGEAPALETVRLADSWVYSGPAGEEIPSADPAAPVYPSPAGPVPYCVLAVAPPGVRLPRSVPVFDVRTFHGLDGALAPWEVTLPEREVWGETAPAVTYRPRLYAGERAEVALGLRGPRPAAESLDGLPGTFYHAASPLFGSGYACKSEGDYAAALKRIRSALAEVWRAYRAAKRDPGANAGHGGAVHYKPVGAYVANYGWGVLADEKDPAGRAIRYF